MRALRTKDFLYIRNFAPDRWPMGHPARSLAIATCPANCHPPKTLESNTYAAFADMDASPTKAWLVQHRTDPKWKWHYDYAFGKRPAEELYDLSKDPDQTNNVAADPAYAAQKQALADDLMSRLKAASDPRVTGDGKTFDQPPFTDVPPAAMKKKAKAKKND